MDGTKLIVLLFYGVLIVLLVILLIKACQAQSKISKKRKQDRRDGIKRFFALEHVEGLGVAEKIPCQVVLDPLKLTITCTGKEYALPLKRITYVDFMVDADKIRYLQSSVAKGVVGAALFGVSGAVIGTTPKTKVEYKAIGYAVIAYRDAKGDERLIILRDQSANSYICNKLVKALDACVHTTIEKVEL